MTPQPDKLFRDKLQHLEMQAPEAAWSRITAGKKTPARIIWLRYAAGLILLLGVGIVFWNTPVIKPSGTLVENNSTTPAEQQLAHPSGQEPLAQTETLVVPEKAKNVIKSKPRQNSVQQGEKPKKETIATEALALNNDPTLSIPDSQEAKETELMQQIIHESTSESSRGVFLVITVDEANQKYLRAQSEDDATQGDKKSSRIQMLMGMAYNLKNSEGGLGDLRQMKDEILALNFLDDKKKKN